MLRQLISSHLVNDASSKLIFSIYKYQSQNDILHKSIMNPLCILCYKPTAVSSVVEEKEKFIPKFFELFARLLKFGLNDGRWKPTERASKGLRLCEDCFNLGNSFSNHYFQLQCVTLQLNWRVRRIWETMSYAGKVPSRVAAFSEQFGGDEQSQGVRRELGVLRKQLLNHCKLHLKSSQPRVSMGKLDASTKKEIKQSTEKSCFQQESQPFLSSFSSSPPPVYEVENRERLFTQTLSFLSILNLLQPGPPQSNDIHSMQYLEMDIQNADDADVQEETCNIVDSSSIKQEQQPANKYQISENAVSDLEENCSNTGFVHQSDDEDETQSQHKPGRERSDMEEIQQSQILNVGSGASAFIAVPESNQSITPGEVDPIETEQVISSRKSLRSLIKCQQCSKTFSNQSKLSSHLQTHIEQVGNDTDEDQECNSEDEKIRKDEELEKGASHKQTAYKRKFRKTGVNNKKFNPPNSSSSSSSSSSESESNDDDIDDRDEDEPRIKKSRASETAYWPKPDFLPPTQCELCHSTFSSQAAVEKHRVFTHNLNSFVRCQGCGKNFCRFTSLRRHRNTPSFVDCYMKDINSLKAATSSEFPRYKFDYAKLFCPKEGCYEIFAYKEHLEIHLNTHGSWSCPTCEMVFEKAHHLALHEMYQHLNVFEMEASNSRYKFHCPRSGCNARTRTKRFMVSHILSKHLDICVLPSTTSKQCPICKKVLRSYSKKEMIAHEKEHDVEGMDPSQISKCRICDAPFKFASSLTRHMRSVHKHETPELVSCSKCQKQSHLKQVHNLAGGELPKAGFAKFNCSICQEKFERQGDLNKHMSSHKNGDSDKLVFPCDVCQAICKTKRSLYNHKKIMHSESNESVCCEQCGKVFRNNLKLRVHVGNSHTDHSLWKFVCPEEGCGRRLFTKQRLTAHLRSHTKERPYVCSFCGSAYSCQSTLRAHLQRIHGPTAAATLPKKRFTKPFDQAIRETESRSEEQAGA